MKQCNSDPLVEQIGVDEDGLFPTNKFENSQDFVVKDHFNEISKLYAIANQEAEPVSDAFINKWITRFGVPMELRSRVYQKLGIRKTHSAYITVTIFQL